jgi:Spy/CpxP family protein refolding chaperone
MSRMCVFALFGAMFVLAGGLVGQDAKKDDPKKDDPPAKVKGKLPQHWGKIGLTDTQKQTIYQIQGKYGSEIDKLKAKIDEIETTRDKEMKAVLTAEQKKALEAAILGKDKEKDK